MRGKKGVEQWIINFILAGIVLTIIFGIIFLLSDRGSGYIEYFKDLISFRK